MKATIKILSTVLLSITTLPALAAEELNAQSANKLTPFAHVMLRGHFNSLLDASAAASAEADKHGAAAFFIASNVDVNSHGDNSQLNIALFHNNAPLKQTAVELRVFNGVTELPKSQAYQLQPFDTVSVSGFFPTQPDVNQAISRAAAKKGAAAFFITRQIDANNGGNQFITAFIYKADAKPRQVQSAELIPANSDAGKAALATSAEHAKGVEKPGIPYQDSPPTNVGRFYQTQSGTQQRYTVTTSQGKSIQEVNDLVAAQMTPFDTLRLTAHFATPVEMTETVATRAAEKGAKFFHITRQWQNQSGGNLTVTAELFH